eukprot:scaffold88088_cov45-Attheya_sp.AAC.1
MSALDGGVDGSGPPNLEQGEESRHDHDGSILDDSPARRLLEQERLSRLPLPRMPEPDRPDVDGSSGNRSRSKNNERPPLVQRPTLRILVVADLDLKSAAALAEFALREGQNDGSHHHHNDSTSCRLKDGNIDLCIACGPFIHHHSSENSIRMENIFTEDGFPGKNEMTRQDMCANEGIITGILSQLESIVCRILFVPLAVQDPLSTSDTLAIRHQRLTPNARNIQRRWMPLAPGLGCTGLSDPILRQTKHTNNREADPAISTAKKLLGLAPQMTPPNTRSTHPSTLAVQMGHEFAQSILVTHVGGMRWSEDRDSSGVKRRGKRTRDLKLLVGELEDSTTESEKHTESCVDWPDSIPTEYRDFLDSKLVQQQVVLNILACHSNRNPQKKMENGQSNAMSDDYDSPFDIQCDNIHLVSPGSLRKYGEFAIIDMALYPNNEEKEEAKKVDNQSDEDIPVAAMEGLQVQEKAESRNSSPAQRRSSTSYSWRVERTQFRSMLD